MHWRSAQIPLISVWTLSISVNVQTPLSYMSKNRDQTPLSQSTEHHSPSHKTHNYDLKTHSSPCGFIQSNTLPEVFIKQYPGEWLKHWESRRSWGSSAQSNNTRSRGRSFLFKRASDWVDIQSPGWTLLFGHVFEDEFIKGEQKHIHLDHTVHVEVQWAL